MHEPGGGGGAAAAACVTVNVWPAIVRVPERASPGLTATLNATGPSPLPLEPEVMVTHDALLPAVQAQLVPAETTTVPVPPAAAIEELVGLIE